MIGLAGTRRNSNCLLFALGLRLALGGRIVRVQSVNWSGPHFVWIGNGHRIELVPVVPRLRRHRLPRLLFDGVVRVQVIGEKEA